MRLVFSAFMLLLTAGPALAAPPTLELAWTAGGLANPESVVPAGDGTYYVSNVAGEGDARDGVGFISRLGAGGELLTREWVGGLHAPKGLLLHAGKLYVADIDALVVIDVARANIEGRHPAPEARFLNDVALGAGGEVLVSDSGGARIYAFADGALTPWLAHEELRAVNGLLPEPGRLLVTTMAGKLLAVDWRTRQIRVLATGLGNADGVARLDDGSYLVGEWPGRLFHVVEVPDSPAGTVATVLDLREGKIYLNDFLRHDGLLLVPNWEPGTLTAYRLGQ